MTEKTKATEVASRQSMPMTLDAQNNQRVVRSKEGARIGVVGGHLEMGLKQKLLLFDQIALPSIDNAIETFRRMPGGDYFANELEFCAKQNLIFRYDNGEAIELAEFLRLNRNARPEKGAYDIAPEVEDLYDLLEIPHSVPREIFMRGKKGKRGDLEKQHDFRQSRIFQLADLSLSIWTRMVARKLRVIDDMNASAIEAPAFFGSTKAELHNLLFERSGRLRAANDVVEVVLNRLPMPSDDAPWEAILEFREDADAKGYLVGLRNWMTDVTQSKLSQKELEEKLDWLLFERSQRLLAHKIACKVGTFGATFVASMSLVEDLLKIRWGKAASGLVSLLSGKAQLTKLELDSPNLEVNYILKVQERFEPKLPYRPRSI